MIEHQHGERRLPMADQPGQPWGADEQAARRAAVALRSMGHPNSIARMTDFSDDKYWWRRLFSEVLGTFFLVLVAVGGGMVNARFGGHAVPYGACFAGQEAAVPDDPEEESKPQIS